MLYPSNPVSTTLADLGVGFVPAVGDERPETGYEFYSLEQLSLLNPAGTVVYPVASDGTAFPDIASIVANPLFTRLPAAQAGSVYGIERTLLP